MKQFSPHLLDSYKLGHRQQYPAGTELIYSNFTPRSNTHFKKPKFHKDEIVFFGLQGTVQEMIEVWNETFFSKPWPSVDEKFKSRVFPFVGVDTPEEVDTRHLKALHELGYLPVRIKALPEGSLVPLQVPVFTIVNTKPEFFWLTNMLETYLSAESWKSCTSATIAYEYRKILQAYAEATGSPADFVWWQGHNFADRGMSGMHDAAKTGAGHLLSFTGSDSVSSVDYVAQYYRGDETFVAGSVPATEHSVICAGGKENETETYRRLLKLYPTGVVSLVADSWDFFNVITNTAAELKEEILTRKPNSIGLAKCVFRPDSGDPVEVLCGAEIQDVSDEPTLEAAAEYIAEGAVDKQAEAAGHGECGDDSVESLFKYKGKTYSCSVEIEWNRYDKQYYYVDGYRAKNIREVTLTPEQKGAVECLWDTFGGTVTDKGFKVLHERVGLIYGDSITHERAVAILERLKAKGFASCNVLFGVGSYTYTLISRDSLGFAMKATYTEANGVGQAIFKQPKTDSGKNSARGLLRVENEGGTLKLYDDQTWEQEASGVLQTVFEDGYLTKLESLANIRSRLGSYPTPSL